MDKNGVITIGKWQDGIATSPYLGFADVRNCEIHYPDGVLKIALAPTKISSTTVTNLPTWMTADRSSGNYYFGGYVDTNIYTFTQNTNIVSVMSSASISAGTGGGIFWKGYLLVTNISSGGTDLLKGYKSGTWYTVGTDLGDSITAGDVTPMYWAQNDDLYIGVGRYLSRLHEATAMTFDPSSSGTYTLTNQSLDIYNYYKIDSITEIGVNLYLGASKRPLGSVIQDSFDGKIFPWNTTDPSFKLPIILDRGGVKQMISRNGNVMLANGRKGQFINTNGSLTQDVQDIATLRNNVPNTFFDIFPEACEFVNGEYLFGIGTSDTAYTPAGIYGFKNNTWRFLEISTGATGTTGTVEIGCILKKDDTKFYVGWQDGSSFGIDEFGTSNYRYTGYRARVDSKLYTVGTVINPKQLQKLQFTLAKPLATGEGIRFWYRFDLSSAWTLFSTYDFATYGAIVGFEDKCLIPACVNLQVRIELTTGASSATTPELINVQLS